MFLRAFLLPFILLVVAVIPVAESSTTHGAAANGFTEPMEDEPDVLTPEVVAKVDANWLLALHPSTAKEYQNDLKRFKVGNILHFLHFSLLLPESLYL